MNQKTLYPFTAIVGQADMKLALILNIINPSIGGVLIKGEKGTAKSTAVRSLVELLPPIEVNEDCRYHCLAGDNSHYCDHCQTIKEHQIINTKRKVIELPISATEDRVVGTLDIEQALQSGKKGFEPGLLAEANNNILYVDEINLLDDHIVDVLLDAAAMGINTVEREGISYSHPSRFTLVGTMNPEEGDIRPQLLDRFGLSVEVHGEQNPIDRVEVIKRRLAYESDPEEFLANYEPQQNELRKSIHTASKLLPSVQIDDEILFSIAELGIALELDGHRGDITLIKTAQTLAAWQGRTKVLIEDIFTACKLVLPHRLHRRPFEEDTFDEGSIRAILKLPAHED